MKRLAVLATTMVLGITTLAGCGPSQGTSPSQNTSTTPGNVTTNTTGSSAGNSTPNSTPSGNSSSSSSGTQTSGQTTQTSPSTTVTPEHQQTLILETMKLAQSGKVPGMPYVAGKTNIADVENAYGAPSQQSSAGAGMYMTYPSHQAAFGFNKGEQIFDIRSFSSQLTSLTLSEVKNTLGAPGEIRELGDQTIYMYPAGPDYQLLWIFGKQSHSTPNPLVQHISVVNPQATVDSMAQDVTAPTVAIDQAPGSAGHSFTFSIETPPQGYRFVEMEWIAKSGQSVVMTPSQASPNTSDANPHFEMSADGKSIAYVYRASDVGQSGYVRLIYQDTEGQAAIGQSGTITLK